MLNFNVTLDTKILSNGSLAPCMKYNFVIKRAVQIILNYFV